MVKFPTVQNGERTSNLFTIMAIELAALCNTVQQNLNALARNNYPAFKRRQVGLLDAVRSPQNTSGFSQRYNTDGGDGKKKTVVIEWAQPVPVSTTVTTEQSVCEGGTEEPRFLDTVELTAFAGTRVMLFTEAELRAYCEQPSEVQTMRIAQHMSGLFEKIDQIGVTKFSAGAGGFIGGPDPGRALSVLHYDADGQTTVAKPDGEVRLLEDMANMGVTGRPIVVGAGNISEYARLANIGCCNDFGQNIQQLSGSYDFFRDREVDRIMAGDNNVLVFAPGAVQMATYNKYRGEFRKIVPDLFAHTTIVDPVTGIELDMKWKYDDCDELWRLHIFLNFDFFLLPDTLFKDADEYDGINYAWLYSATKTSALS